MVKRNGINSTIKAIMIWHIIIICHCLSQYVCKSENTDRPIDLSHEFNDRTIFWVTSKDLNVTITVSGPFGQVVDWYLLEEYETGTHGGTHIDAPCHMAINKWCISDIPPSNLIIPAIVIDISNHVGDNPERHLKVDDVTDWEEKHGAIPDSSLVLIRTGWARFWPNRLSYIGSTEKNASLLKYPSILPEAAQWIVDNRNIVGMGIDTLSTDSPDKLPGTHLLLATRNMYSIANINNELRLLPPKGLTAYVMPMKLKAAGGASCALHVIINKKNGEATSQKKDATTNEENDATTNEENDATTNEENDATTNGRSDTQTSDVLRMYHCPSVYVYLVILLFALRLLHIL